MDTAHILLVEDDDDLRQLLSLALHVDGHKVMEARTGREALDLVMNAAIVNRVLDIIVTDVRLPGIGGLTLLSGIRALGWMTPLVVMTAHDIDTIRRQAQRIGVDVVLEKPFDVNDFRAAVAHVLRWHQRLACG